MLIHVVCAAINVAAGVYCRSAGCHDTASLNWFCAGVCVGNGFNELLRRYFTRRATCR